uniref:Uncharacterized protein n=1 Tax=Tanacetum cinerariifolium TaxID=118510 RepID=A0A6L2JA11_TANCI|nr:hypothetical protein [Tanacetum cinerariifolium]
MYRLIIVIFLPTSNAQRTSTIIRLRIPPRRSTRLTPPTPIRTAAEVEGMIVQDTIQLSIVEQKSRDDLEAKQNEEKVKEHLIVEGIKKWWKERRIYLFGNLKIKTRFLARKKFNVLAQHLQEVMEESLPNMVDSSVRNYMSGHIFQHDDLPVWLALKIKFEGLHASNTPCISSAIYLRYQDDTHDDAHPKRENSAKSANSLAGATQQLSSGNHFALTVAKYSNSGIFIANSGNALEHFIALTVGKCTSRGIFITSSGNALKHFIPNNPLLNLMLHLQSSFQN